MYGAIPYGKGWFGQPFKKRKVRATPRYKRIIIVEGSVTPCPARVEIEVKQSR